MIVNYSIWNKNLDLHPRRMSRDFQKAKTEKNSKYEVRKGQRVRDYK